jgi:hypothetical protein
VLRTFEEAFSERVWEGAKVLVIGAILAKGRANGRSDRAGDGMLGREAVPERSPQARVAQSGRERSRVLWLLLVRLCVAGNEPAIMGTDETIERRRGRVMASRGVSRDPVRSSKKLCVKTGWRWMCLMLLTPIPWACRVWAVPFVTVPAPSERSHEERHKRHTTITDWAWQMILHVVRWMPGRRVVVVADGTSAVLEFLRNVSRLPAVSAVTRVRLDACVYDPAPVPKATTHGRPALKGNAQPTLAQRLTDPTTPWQNRRWPGLGEPRSRWRSPQARLCGLHLPFPLPRSARPRRAHGSALDRGHHLS